MDIEQLKKEALSLSRLERIKLLEFFVENIRQDEHSEEYGFTAEQKANWLMHIEEIIASAKLHPLKNIKG